jgi:hypothetical protein
VTGKWKAESGDKVRKCVFTTENTESTEEKRNRFTRAVVREKRWHKSQRYSTQIESAVSRNRDGGRRGASVRLRRGRHRTIFDKGRSGPWQGNRIFRWWKKLLRRGVPFRRAGETCPPWECYLEGSLYTHWASGLAEKDEERCFAAVRITTVLCDGLKWGRR